MKNIKEVLKQLFCKHKYERLAFTHVFSIEGKVQLSYYQCNKCNHSKKVVSNRDRLDPYRKVKVKVNKNYQVKTFGQTSTY